MHIILGRENIDSLLIDQKFTVLELDTFRLPPDGRVIEAFCVVENVPITNMPRVNQMKELHANLLINFRKQDWNYCEQALEHLVGFWGSEMDSFYQSIKERMTEQQNTQSTEWQWVVDKTLNGQIQQGA